MDKIIKFIFLILFAGNILQVNAQSIELKTVEDAIKLSLEKNPELEIYNLKQEKSQHEYKIKRRSGMPKVSGNIEFQNNIEKQTSTLPGELFGRPGETVNAQLGSQYNYNAGLNVTTKVIDFERKMEIKLSKLNVEIQSVQREIFIQLMKEKTAVYYYGALIIKHALDINKTNLVSTENILEVTQQKFDEGVIDLPSLNQAKIMVNNIHQAIKTNQSMYNNYIYNLKVLFDLEADDSIIFSEKIDIETNNISFITQIKEDKNLKTFDFQIKQSELDIKLKKAAFYPKLTTTRNIGYSQFYNDGGVSFSSDSWHRNISFGVNLSIPIFCGFKNSKSLKIAKINHMINEQTIDIERKKSINADELLLKDYQNGLMKLNSTEQNYELYKQNVEISLQKYNKGIISLEVYLRTYEDYLKSESNYLNSLSAVYANYSTIRSRQ